MLHSLLEKLPVKANLRSLVFRAVVYCTPSLPSPWDMRAPFKRWLRARGGAISDSPVFGSHLDLGLLTCSLWVSVSASIEAHLTVTVKTIYEKLLARCLAPGNRDSASMGRSLWARRSLTSSSSLNPQSNPMTRTSFLPSLYKGGNGPRQVPAWLKATQLSSGGITAEPQPAGLSIKPALMTTS